ncbi:PTS beta-glucoside transporter subunit EIIBCA [Aerococcus urinaeequi]|uniref:PTS beta-glucoside transporter subunit EIIBCA n=1 Tax=Aerococcus urinaeequi TaxID=51665 RepID=A0AAC8X1D8_9LACT|nr:glucose PTS transporter subunit IIA [Aerococcus urinaeequi]ALZ88116.1 PTS beta-glucoside transporter subunit EIIBCA [Aerococcus urinaeequi]AMB98091.1 PTS beta-glucoside transporter subunit EIIBCA [Aerococcus urinaeequi]
MDYKKLAKDIVTNVGGEDNIQVVNHCMTRLRFNLKDNSKPDKKVLEGLEGVLGVVYAGDQYMVILGQHLLPTYEEIVNNYHVKAGESIDENLDDLSNTKEPLSFKNAGGRLIGFISSSVTPLIPGLIAGGMLKVVLLLVVTFLSPEFAESSSHQLLSAIADAPFYFMPLIVAYGAATKLGGTPVYSIVAAAALLHGNYTGLVTEAATNVNLFGINVPLLSYGTSLLPALLIAVVAYYAEKYLNKIVPGIFKSVFVGMGTVLIAGGLAFVVLGPLGNMLGQVIASVFMFLSGTIGPIAVGLLAAALPWMVMTGMHTAIAPFMTQLLVNPGYDAIIRPAFLLHNMAEGGANLGVAARTKNAKLRSECISLAIGCIVAGVTEPAIYGVNLKYRKPMYGVMAGGFVGGVVASLLGARVYIMGYSNLLALPIFQETVMAIVIGIVATIVTAAVVTYMLGIDETESVDLAEPVKALYPDDAIVAITEGDLLPLTEVNDETFSKKMLGDGVAFKLDSDFICAPANGQLTTLFPTGHAFGITTKEGIELLVHIGIDTVNLKGEGFDVLVEQGEEVRAGEPIVRVDREKITAAGYDLTTMLILTNDFDHEIQLNNQGQVKVGTSLN